MTLNTKSKKPDNREYTIMIVPHQGQSVCSLRIPIRLIKYSAAVLCIILIGMLGTFVSYKHTVNMASAERSELDHLRNINQHQNQQIEQLAQATASLQEDMTRLNVLDSELRRMVNGEEMAGTSRSGITRPSGEHNGQGGPIVKPQVDDLVNLVQEMKATAKVREQSLTDLRQSLKEKNARLSATPSIWPTSGDVTSRFGWRSSPWGWGSDWHPGIDVANSYGTPIVATASGVVVESGWYGGYGKIVKIDHGNGIVTLYAHNSSNAVNVGQTVEKGEVIAYMGSTGSSTGSHVHYEVIVNGTKVNPANFL